MHEALKSEALKTASALATEAAAKATMAAVNCILKVGGDLEGWREELVVLLSCCVRSEE